MKFCLCITLLMIVPLSACSGPPENAESANANASEQANSNASAQPQAVQNSTPLPVQTIPPSDPNASVHKGQPPANPRPEPAKATSQAKGPAPKLIAPEQKINFGKQPQDKSLVRAINIRNAGRAVLNIESVVPS